jgi:hypothetical protein
MSTEKHASVCVHVITVTDISLAIVFLLIRYYSQYIDINTRIYD